MSLMLADEERACAPASRPERMALVEALLQHYPPRAFNSGEQQFWLDWMSDTDGLPAPILAEACAKWRRSAEKWGPSSGQLLAKVRSDWRYRLLLLRRAVDVLKTVDNGVDSSGEGGA